MEHDITKSLKSVKILTKTWTPEGGQPSQYKRLALQFVLNGNVRTMELKIEANQILVLESLPVPDNDLLAGDHINPDPQ